VTAAFRGDFCEIIGENKNFDEIAYGNSDPFCRQHDAKCTLRNITSFVDQHSIALSLSMKELSAKVTYQDPVQTLGAETLAYFVATWCRRATKFPV
jgi:hypothetical protein